MTIAVLATGPVGQTLAGALARLGYKVTAGTRAPDATLPDLKSAAFPQTWELLPGTWLDKEKVVLICPGIEVLLMIWGNSSIS